jgi:hypothetical protein
MDLTVEWLVHLRFNFSDELLITDASGCSTPRSRSRPAILE